MIQQPDENLQTPDKEGEGDKLYIEDGSSLQSPKEEGQVKKDDYYEVDEKKLVITNIGDGTPIEEGLAGIDDDEPEKKD